MKVFLSADIEGCCGVAFIHDMMPGKSWFPYFQKQLGREVAAACEGALAAGAEKILVRDSHYLGCNIIPTDLPEDERIFLSRGVPHDPYVMMGGIQDDKYDAAIFVASHSGRHSRDTNVAHTFTDALEVFTINGVNMSEFTLSALMASYNNVPVVFLSGDKGACDEAEDVMPGITTVSTFELQGGRAVVAQHPNIVVRKIRETVQEALEGDFSKLIVPLPEEFDMRMRFHAHAQAFNMSYYPGAERLDNFTVRLCSKDFMDILRFIHFAVIPLRGGEFDQD